MYASQTHFGFTNMGSKTHIFRVMNSQRVKNVSGTPCMFHMFNSIKEILKIGSFHDFFHFWHQTFQLFKSQLLKSHGISILTSKSWNHVPNLDGAFAWKLPKYQFKKVHGSSNQNHYNHVWDEECASAIFIGFVGEPPHIWKKNKESGIAILLNWIFLFKSSHMGSGFWILNFAAQKLATMM